MISWQQQQYNSTYSSVQVRPPWYVVANWQFHKIYIVNRRLARDTTTEREKLPVLEKLL